MLKAQLEEAKRAEKQRAKLEKEAQEKTAKAMQNLAAKKQAQKAEIDAIEQKIKARNERGRSRRQSIEDAKMRIASRQAELEKQKMADEVKREMIAVASVMAARIVQANIDTNAQHQLIEETLKEIGDSTWLS